MHRCGVSISLLLSFYLEVDLGQPVRLSLQSLARACSHGRGIDSLLHFTQVY